MIGQFLRKLSNLKCPSCAALHDWSTATNTVPWMTKINADQIPSFECATCKPHLRLKNDHSTILFTACFVAGMFTLAGFLSGIANSALGDGLTVQFGVLLIVLWLLLGSIVLWSSARLLELEIAE